MTAPIQIQAPTSYPHDDERPHSCGRCRTPWGVTNPECPNAPRAQ